MRVQCEYCDSYVESGTNCPNCGAVLPRPKQPDALDARFVNGASIFYQDILGNGAIMNLQSQINQLEHQYATAASVRYPSDFAYDPFSCNCQKTSV